MTSSRCEDYSAVLSLRNNHKTVGQIKDVQEQRPGSVSDIWGGFFVFLFLSAVVSTSSALVSGGEQAECSLALGGVSNSSGSLCSRALCSWANSACLTSGMSWSTIINNTAFFPARAWSGLLILAMKFISIHLRAVGTTHTHTHSEKMTARQGRVSSWRRSHGGISWRARAHSYPLSHSWNIYQHNPSSLDQLHTCHGCPINYECVSNKDQSHWFLSLLWDGFTKRDILSVAF